MNDIATVKILIAETAITITADFRYVKHGIETRFLLAGMYKLIHLESAVCS